MESGLSLFREEQISPHDWNKVNRGTNGRREAEVGKGRSCLWTVVRILTFTELVNQCTA